MKRSILASLTVLALVTHMAFVSAQGSDQPNYGGRLLRRYTEQIRKEQADQLRFERARIRSRQRMEQELANERMGRSTLRPYTNLGRWGLGLDQR
jgi:hypothetical protein